MVMDLFTFVSLAVKSLPEDADREVVAKTLASALVAEAAKIMSSSPSSSPSRKRGKRCRSSSGGESSSSTTSPSSAGTENKTTTTTTLSELKSTECKIEASASTKPKLGKSSPPTKVKLEGIGPSLSHRDVVDAVRQFGKTKSVILFRSNLEATVFFEKEEDAKKLRSIKNFKIKEMAVSVAKEEFFFSGKKIMLITNLPKYHDGCYTVEDLANLLIPFGFKYEEENIYVVPQAQKAFAMMPTVQEVDKVLRNTRFNDLTFKNSKLSVKVVKDGISMAPAPAHRVYRLKIPNIGCTAPPPRFAANAIPDSKDVLPGTTVPASKFGVPKGSLSPFWVMLTVFPFVFPTVSPWFIIPDHLTVKESSDIAKAKHQGSVFSTVMLTGLPEGNYKHEDIAKLVWPYFTKHNLQSLYYNVIVLTLQRRAFVYFSNWTSCCSFVRDHLRKPFSVRGSTLQVHFVLEQICPESTEELMYKTLMKWCNARVPDLESLEERLLCVEISETSLDVIRIVMDVVASIAPFVGFLPLANRSLKQRLEDSSEATVNLEQGTIKVEAKPPTKPPPAEVSDEGPQPAPQLSISAPAKPAAPAGSGPSATGTSDEAMEEASEKLGPEIIMESTVSHQSNEGVERLKREEASPPTALTTSSPTSLVKSAESVTEPLHVEQETCSDQHKLTQGARTRTEEKQDFLTSDEVGYQQCSPSSKKSSVGTREERSSDVSSAKQTSTVALGLACPSSSSSSASSKSMSNNSSSPSPTKPSPPPLSPDAPLSPDQKAQQSKTKSPVKTSSETSLSGGVGSSPTMHEKKKVVSEVDTVEEEIKTHPGSGGEATESAVAKCESEVSAEPTAAKTVEPKKTVETSSEMHPPAQEQRLELSQAQILEIDFKDNTLQDLERSKEGKKQDDVGKHPEQEEEEDEDQSLEACDTEDVDNDVTEQETFEILDSTDDQVGREDQSPVLETPIDQTPKEDMRT
ncbi:hypothetical protein INR49_022737 [Caranx melampygus]|nr:hypothetical protein INR49_022737 [Caranx melampygus]